MLLSSGTKVFGSEFEATALTKISLFYFSLFFFFYKCLVPLGFLSWETQITFSGEKPAATESRYPTYGAFWVF